MDKEIFYCQKCGHCCEGKGGIVVSLEEQNKISSFLNLSIEEFQKKYLEQNQGKDVIKTKNDFCIFFDPKKGCGIHPVKPKVCAAWPFFRGNLVDENAFEMAKTYCPGINKNISFEKFKKYGISYLKENNLICEEKKGPTALQIKDLL